MEWAGMVVAIVFITSGTGVLTSWIKHRTKVVEMKLQAHGLQSDSGLRAEVEALRQEVRQLRDTTMQYDLSFDSALQRLDSRMDGVERRVNTIQTPASVEQTLGR